MFVTVSPDLIPNMKKVCEQNYPGRVTDGTIRTPRYDAFPVIKILPESPFENVEGFI